MAYTLYPICYTLYPNALTPYTLSPISYTLPPYTLYLYWQEQRVAAVEWGPWHGSAPQLPPGRRHCRDQVVFARCAGEVGRLAEVRLEDGSTLHARLVVGADGARSRCGPWHATIEGWA